MTGDTEQDITGWPVERLDELALAVYAGVDGVTVDEVGAGDGNGPHGHNTDDDKTVH